MKQKDKAFSRSLAQINEGDTFEHRYDFSASVSSAFLSAFDDRSPIHVDPDYAKKKGFDGCVMHGAVLNGFISHFVGMVFPGARSLLLATDIRYLSPTYLNETLLLRSKVSQVSRGQSVVILNIEFLNESRGTKAAKAKVQVRLQDE